MDADAAVACLPNSTYSVCAFQGEEMVGMGRVVGDRGLCFYIQDVIVLKEHQGRGVGAGLMDRIMDHISRLAVQDTYIGLMAATGKEGFYARYGFTARPTTELGAGMTLFWKASPTDLPGRE